MEALPQYMREVNFIDIDMIYFSVSDVHFVIVHYMVNGKRLNFNRIESVANDACTLDG